MNLGIMQRGRCRRAGTGRASGKPLTGRRSSARVLQGGGVFVARLFPLLGGGSCAAGAKSARAKSASWNGPGGWQEHGGPWHRRPVSCRAARLRGVGFSPVGRQIVRSGGEVGQGEVGQGEVGQLERAGRMAIRWRGRRSSASVLQGGPSSWRRLFPVGRRIVRSGHEVGQLERQDDGGNIILHICKYENRLL